MFSKVYLLQSSICVCTTFGCSAASAYPLSSLQVDLPGEPEYYAKPSIVEAYDKFHFGSTRYFGIRNFCEHFAEASREKFPRYATQCLKLFHSI